MDIPLMRFIQWGLYFVAASEFGLRLAQVLGANAHGDSTAALLAFGLAYLYGVVREQIST